MVETRPHPRASWCDPVTGELIDGRLLMRRMATKRAVLLGEIGRAHV